MLIQFWEKKSELWDINLRLQEKKSIIKKNAIIFFYSWKKENDWWDINSELWVKKVTIVREKVKTTFYMFSLLIPRNRLP